MSLFFRHDLPIDVDLNVVRPFEASYVEPLVIIQGYNKSADLSDIHYIDHICFVRSMVGCAFASCHVWSIDGVSPTFDQKWKEELFESFGLFIQA
jgi:hypothetical protein